MAVAEQSDWLSMFNRTSMQAITVHEVAPGHFAHGRSLRHLTSPVRQTLIGGAFTEGWAHYAEEMVFDEGFHADDPRYAIGMCLEALCRLTRLTCAIGPPPRRDRRSRGDPALSEAGLPHPASGAVGSTTRNLRSRIRHVHLGEVGNSESARAGPRRLGR